MTDVRAFFEASEQDRAEKGLTRVATVSKFTEQPTALTFHGLITGRNEAVSKTGTAYLRVTFVPLDLCRLKSTMVEVIDKETRATASVPLFDFATADHRAIWLNVYEDTIQKGSKGVKGIRETRLAPTPLLIAERVPITVSVFRGEVPKEMALVTVYNAMATLYNDQVTVSEVQSFDPATFGDENEGPLGDRLALVFPPEQQHVPAILPLNLLPEEERDAIPMPLVRLMVNRDRCVPEAEQGGDLMWRLPNVIKTAEMIAANPPGTMEDAAVTDVTYLACPESYVHWSGAGASDPLDRTEVRLSLRVRQLPNGADRHTVRHFLLNRVTLYGESCVGLGTRYPRTVQALLSHHAVPFQILFEPYTDKTMAESANNDPTGKLRAGFEDGILNGRLCVIDWQMRDYLLQRGIPVERETAEQRFTQFVQPRMPDDFDAICAARKIQTKTNKTFDRAELKNPLTEFGPTHASGIVALDEYKGMLPDALHFDFYCLALMSLPDAARTEGTAMTPAEGSKLVMAQRGNVAAGGNPNLPWLLPAQDPAQPNRRIPKFLFYAVKKQVQVTSPLAGVPVVDVTPTSSAVGTVVDAAAGEVDVAATLPPNLEALRAQLMEGNVTRGSLKRPREEATAVQDENEPRAKEARVD
jgi:hypothetical protein